MAIVKYLCSGPNSSLATGRIHTRKYFFDAYIARRLAWSDHTVVSTFYKAHKPAVYHYGVSVQLIYTPRPRSSF